MRSDRDKQAGPRDEVREQARAEVRSHADEQGQAITRREKRNEARKKDTAGMPPEQAEAARREVAAAAATPWLDVPLDEGNVDPEVARDLAESGATPQPGPPAASDGKRKPYKRRQ